MARFQRLICATLCCAFVLFALVASRSALASGPSPNEGAAYGACMAWAAAETTATGGVTTYTCFLHSNFSGLGGNTCPVGRTYYNGVWYFGAPQNNPVDQFSPSFTWCVSSSCSGTWGTPSNGFSVSPVGTHDPADDGNCCTSWVQTSTWTFAGTHGEDGYYERTGGYCNHNYRTNGGQQNPDQSNKYCDPGSSSCYSPENNTACYTTESGESVCKKLDDDSGSGCAVGATGAECVGKNGAAPPSPPDPPIAKGQSPDSSASATTSSGGTTNNYTTNNYSGTSPGSGNSGTPQSASSAGGTSGSNQNGSGNSPGPKGDHGTDSNGKCPDGSVPTASGCSGTATDNGCNAPPACFGDAVMCASFREEVAIRCNTAKAASGSSSGGLNIGDPSSALAQAGIPADGGASGDPSSSGLVSSSDIGEDGFDASGLGFARTCPANPSFVVLGHTYTLDLQPLCNFATLLGWFVLLCAFLVALRVVATSKA